MDQRDVDRLLRRIRARTVRRGGCLVFETRVRDEGRSLPRINYRGHKLSVRRFLWWVRNGEIPAGHAPLRSCQTPNCVGHLFLATPEERAWRRGALLSGEKHPNAKVTLANVRSIRRAPTRYHSPGTIRPLMERYNLSRSTVCKIRAGERWEGLA